MDTQLVWVALAAFLGTIVAALLGWANSAEPFDRRKFSASALRGLVAAVVFAGAIEVTDTVASWSFLFAAFLGGAGLDVLGKRGQDVASQPAPIEAPADALVLYDTYAGYQGARNTLLRGNMSVEQLDRVNWPWVEGQRQGISWELLAVAVKALKAGKGL